MKTNQRWQSGALLRIPLDHQWFCYGQMLPHENCEMAFFDVRVEEELEPRRIVALPALFRAAVHKSAYNDGRWLKAGTAPIPEVLLEPRETYIEDSMTGNFV